VPREVFVAGQILTAAEMNVVSDQTVMSFAGTAARGSAIPSPTEGMVTYLEDANGLTVYDGSAWVPAASGATLGSGSILQVVQTVKTNAFSVTLAEGAQDTNDITGLTVSITPRATSSKVLVMVQLSVAYGSVSLFRNGSNLNYIGDSAGTRTRVSSGAGEGGARTAAAVVLNYLDSPNTTSAVTYSLRLTSNLTGTAAVRVNQGSTTDDDDRYSRSASSITVMEIAG
jgi:hypothetical protein